MAKAKKKQKFFDVDMPILEKETQLYGYSVEDLDGRTIDYDLTRLLRGKSMLLKLKVKVKNKEEKPTSYPIELKLMPYFLRRMVRKGTNYVEDSFSTETKNARVRIKPFFVTRKKVSRVVRKALREKAKQELIEHMKDKKTETIFEELLKNQIQKPLSLKLKKIYPLSLCEIRVFKIEEEFEEKKEDKKESKKKKIETTEKTKAKEKSPKKEEMKKEKKETKVKEK